MVDVFYRERGNSLTSWYLDTNQIRNCDIPHRELMGSSEDGSTDPSSMPSMSLAFRKLNFAVFAKKNDRFIRRRNNYFSLGHTVWYIYIDIALIELTLT